MLLSNEETRRFDKKLNKTCIYISLRVNYNYLTVLQLKSYFFNKHLIFKKEKNYIFVCLNKYFFFFLPLGQHLFTKFNKQWGYVFKNWLHLYYFYFRYLSFVGKSYKISFNKKCINLNFNKANINYLILNAKTWTKLLAKNKIFFKSIHCESLAHLYKLLLRVRMRNIFTARGLKLSQSIIFKKKGKVSSYTTQSNLI